MHGWCVCMDGITAGRKPAVCAALGVCHACDYLPPPALGTGRRLITHLSLTGAACSPYCLSGCEAQPFANCAGAGLSVEAVECRLTQVQRCVVLGGCTLCICVHLYVWSGCGRTRSSRRAQGPDFHPLCRQCGICSNIHLGGIELRVSRGCCHACQRHAQQQVPSHVQRWPGHRGLDFLLLHVYGACRHSYAQHLNALAKLLCSASSPCSSKSSPGPSAQLGNRCGLDETPGPRVRRRSAAADGRESFITCLTVSGTIRPLLPRTRKH